MLWYTSSVCSKGGSTVQTEHAKCACADRSQALRLEARIKKTPQRQKCLLLHTDPL